MDVRDAVESDAETLAELAGAPADVMRNVIHDRTVRVAEVPLSGDFNTDNDPAAGGDGDAGDGDAADGDAADGDAAVDADVGGESEEHDGRDGDTDADGSRDADGAREVAGFLSFDVRADTVHVTQFGGDRTAFDRLLDEPVGFADREGLSTEVLVTDGDDAMRGALEAAGFEDTGSGPTFGGHATTRYRRE